MERALLSSPYIIISIFTLSIAIYSFDSIKPGPVCSLVHIIPSDFGALVVAYTAARKSSSSERSNIQP